MLTAEENERLTRVGPEKPAGDLMRRYWHPIAATAQLSENPVKAIRVLGEDLTLFKDKSGNLGLIGNRCAHRHAELVYGIPDERGLRCCYHGWLYDGAGRCLDQPTEPEGSKFSEKIQLRAYPVQELAGIVWAYLGPDPAPLLPRWDRLVWQGNQLSVVLMTVVPCNWLQVAENYPDFFHSEWLHGWFRMYLLEREGATPDDPRWIGTLQRVKRHQKAHRWDLFEYGILSRLLMEDESEDAELWRVGLPMLFPNVAVMSSGNTFHMQWVVPVDDTHTSLMSSRMYRFGPEVEVPTQEEIPYYEHPWDMPDEQGRPRLDMGSVQDNLIFVTQGEIADRTKERLGDTDRGIILYRKLLQEQIGIVADGGQPMNVFRDPERNISISLPEVKQYYAGGRANNGTYRWGSATEQTVTGYSPIGQLVEDLFVKEAEAMALKTS